MSLTLYIGPMFAGKSSTVLGIVRRNDIIGRKTLCITNYLDNRYRKPGFITSHDNESRPAIAVNRLMPVVHRAIFHEADCIIIEEAQFFTDLKEFALDSTEVYGKEVIVVGLDGDSARKPFGQVIDLIPYCDAIHKLTALCTECRDGTPALFSHRKAHANSQISVGAQDKYEPLCRYHYLNAIFYKQVEDHISKACLEKLDSSLELKRCVHLFGTDHGSAVFSEIVRRRLVD